MLLQYESLASGQTSRASLRLIYLQFLVADSFFFDSHIRRWRTNISEWSTGLRQGVFVKNIHEFLKYL